MLERNKFEDLGIEVLYRVEDKNIIELANKISAKLINFSDDIKINSLEMYKRIISTDMYYAKIPLGLTSVNYSYKTSAMYFKEDTDFSKVDEFMLHECMHMLQEKRDKKGKIIGYGLCEVNDFSVKGSALNEGAIQYIVSKILRLKKKEINVYGIKINSTTEYYPVLTNIIAQLAILLDERILINSVIESDENFKIEIIDYLGEKIYNQIEKNCNDILYLKDNSLYVQNNAGDFDDSTFKIKQNVEEIKNIFFDTQKLIYTSYFNNCLKRCENEIEIKFLKEKLNSYKKIIGVCDSKNDFDVFYNEFLNKADKKIEDLKNKKALIVIGENVFIKIFKRIKRLFTSSQNEVEQ